VIVSIGIQDPQRARHNAVLLTPSRLEMCRVEDWRGVP
jgi:hypothetical protein